MAYGRAAGALESGREYQRDGDPGINRGMASMYSLGQISLGPFLVDLAIARLFRGGHELKLRPQVFQVLRFLIQNPGRLVDFDEMIQEAWAGARVSRHTVAVTLGELKSLLEECGHWITIRPGYGYCLEIPESEHLMRVGQHFRNQLTPSGLDNAIRLFDQVAKIEGASPRAWEALAGSYLESGAFSTRPPRDVHRLFLDAYHRAVALQGLTPGLQLSRALSLYLFEQKFAEAESELLWVRRAKPRLAEVYVHLARVYFISGRPDESLGELRLAENVDALSPALAFAKPCLLLYGRDADGAAAAAKQAVALYPNAPLTHLHYADVLDFAGDAPAALGQYHIASTIAPEVPLFRAAEARCLAKQGQSREATAILAELKLNRKTQYVDAYHLALLLEALGQRDEAFEELERSHAERSPMVAWLDLDTKTDSLRNDPRFAKLRDRIAAIAS
jgi:DNA-binding winged helix-turn-helix (wHTH) protein